MSGRRIDREKKTIAAMMDLYCRDRHASEERPCAECRQLLDYAYARLDKCPFGEEKTTCANCPIHCYKSDQRRQVSRVMRYAGPRMLTRYPILALGHLMDGLKDRIQPSSARKPTKKEM